MMEEEKEGEGVMEREREDEEEMTRGRGVVSRAGIRRRRPVVVVVTSATVEFGADEVDAVVASVSHVTSSRRRGPNVVVTSASPRPSNSLMHLSVMGG